MLMYLSKYALGAGGKIREVSGTISSDGQYLQDGAPWASFYRIGRDAHETREAALADAESRRAKKIASLQKQIAKLEKMTFS